MKYQIENYYHHNSPARKLDQQINPFISHLQQYQITSLHQLHSHLHHQTQTLTLTKPFHNNFPIFNQPAPKLPTHHTKPKNLSIHNPKIFDKRNISSLQKVVRSIQDPQERIIIVNEYSKIKKHLIESINIDEMEQALYKKRQTINRFEQFCQKIKTRDLSTRKKTKSKHQAYTAEWPNRSKQHNYNPDLQISDKQIFSNTFRITSRRKFNKPNNDDDDLNLNQYQPFQVQKMSRTMGRR